MTWNAQQALGFLTLDVEPAPAEQHVPDSRHTPKISPAGARVLAVVDATPAGSGLAGATDPVRNQVHAGTARALVRAGVLVEFMGPDGFMVRRPDAEQSPEGD